MSDYGPGPVPPRNIDKQKLKALIDDHLPSNHRGEITAEKLREVLKAIVDAL